MPIDPENPISKIAQENWGDQFKKPAAEPKATPGFDPCFGFGKAIELLKTGKKVRRLGWNGKGMYLYFVPENSYPAVTDIAKEEFGASVPYHAYIAMKTVQNKVVPWLASQTDILSDDWQIANT